MIVDKCLLQIKVLRLLILFGAFSSIVVLIIFSIPNGDQTTVSTFDSVFLDTWPIRASINVHMASDLHAPRKKLPLFGDTSHLRRIIVHRDRYGGAREKIKRIAMHASKVDEHFLSKNTSLELAKHNIRNIHIFYTFPMHWFDADTMDKHASVLSSSSLSSSSRLQPNVAFYPMHGFYETTDDVLRQQLIKIKSLGIGVIVITWSPQFQHKRLQHLMAEAEQLNLQIIIEFDDYQNRTVHTLSNDLRYFFMECWHHGGFYKVYTISKVTYMPMFYVRNFDAIAINDWMKLLAPNGILSIRNTKQNAIFIGHISTKKHVSAIKAAHFNGFYNRMPSNGATYASTWKYWADLKHTADKYRLVFIPTVGPGYDDMTKTSKIGGSKRHRTNGQYYNVACRRAMHIGAEFISINSFNDWRAGTQIEEAKPRSGFRDYSPANATKYIEATRYWVNEMIGFWTLAAEKHPKHSLKYFNNTVY